MKPPITVLLSVYNGEQFLRQALESVLNQSFDDFEFLIIDDGSNDNTLKILETLTDPRVRLIKHNRNWGLTKSLNQGLQLAKGTYIARMDADDVCQTDRLKLQKDFLDYHPDTALVGAWIEVRDDMGATLEFQKFPTSSALLRWQLMFKNSFAHASVMYRKDAALDVEGYRENCLYTEDYDLWSRLSFQWEMANIPQVLLRRRESENTVSGINREKQMEFAERISRRNMQRVWGGEMEIGLFRMLRRLYVRNNSGFRTINLFELQNVLDVLLWRFLKIYNYTNASIRKDLRVEIATHTFMLFFGTRRGLLPKTTFLLHWFITCKPNMLRIVHNFFFNRTLTGTGLRKVFGNL